MNSVGGFSVDIAKTSKIFHLCIVVCIHVGKKHRSLKISNVEFCFLIFC